MAQRTRGDALLGGVLVAIWGVELVLAVVGWLGSHIPLGLDLPAAVQAEVIENARSSFMLRGMIAVFGVAAGAFIFAGRRSGHWLAIGSAIAVLTITDLHWFAYLVPGAIHSRPIWFFFVKAPSLGYAVLVFPVLIASLAVASVVSLFRGRGRVIPTVRSAS